jgi:hypothetical protein
LDRAGAELQGARGAVIDRKGHANALAWQAGFADIARTQKRVFFNASAGVF